MNPSSSLTSASSPVRSVAGANDAAGGLLPLVLGTSSSWSAPVARLTLAVVMFPHGAQKLLGWYGGYGWDGTMGFFTENIGLPAVLAALIILFEFLGPLALLLGLGTRLAAAGVGAIMVGAIATVHGANGFLMNWTGTQAGEGYEYHLLMIGLAAVLFLQGAGRFSLDRLLTRRASAAPAH